MPAAAALPDIMAVGSVQNNGSAANTPQASTTKAITVRVGLSVRKEPGLGQAEQRPEDVEGGLGAKSGRAGDAGDERHQRRNNAPADHDARDPPARAEAVEQEIRRQLEQEVREKEDTGAEAEHGRREPERLV